MTADVLERQARVEGRPLAWAAAAVGGGLAGQHAVEEELMREGRDRALLGRDAFLARAGAVAEAGRARLGSLVDGLGLGLDVDAVVVAGEQAARAARTAFVRLFDEGLVVEDDRVVEVCPRCATVVAAADAVPVEIGADLLTVRLPLVDDGEGPGDGEVVAHVEVACLAPELFLGAVAVAVPDGHPAAGRFAAVPLAPATVPVVADPSARAPALVVPAHAPADLELARRSGLPVVPVLDASGTVRVVGPLDGLARYAARAAARQLLEAEGVVVSVEEAGERASRCPACGTALVPRLGRHWFLALGELAPAAADAVRDGQVGVSQPARREELLRQAVTEGEWCLSQQLWVGVPVPVARCRDCGHADVSVEAAASCGRCMGDLVADADVLDARFVRCMWPLAACGWPGGGRWPGPGAPASSAILLVIAAGDVPDLLAMVALGLRLGGAVPFGQVAVTPDQDPEPGHDEGAGPAGVQVLLDEEGRRVVRLALACGGLEVAQARQLVGWLDAVPAGAADVDRLVEVCRAAFAQAAPASALGMVAAALAQGVPPGRAPLVRALAAPFLGE